MGSVWMSPIFVTPLSPAGGLVSWWPGNGDARDVVGGHHGTLENGATFAKGMVGDAFCLDGVNAFVRVPSSPDLNPKHSFTLSARVFPRVDGNFHIVAKWGDSGEWSNQRAYALFTLSGCRLAFGISGAESQSNMRFHVFESPLDVVALMAWNFVAAVYDQRVGARRIYVNGVLVAERRDPPITVTDSIADLCIGGVLAAPKSHRGAFPGLIAEVQILNRAVSPLEIRAIFDAGKAGRRSHVTPNAHSGSDLGMP